MILDEVKVVGGPLVLATAEQVQEASDKAWANFPDGYAEFVTTLGEGRLGTFVRVYPPWRINMELAEWRSRIRQYWNWNGGKDVLPQDRAVECVIVADSMDGDELIFHPGRPNRLFVLPRHSSKIFEAGADFNSAIEWMLTSGKLNKPISDRDFVPDDSRKWPRNKDKTGKEEPVESLQPTVEKLAAWSKKLKLPKRAEASCRDYLFRRENPKYQAEDLKFEIGNQYLVFKAGKYESREVSTTVIVTQKSSDEELGKFIYHTDLETGENYHCSIEGEI